MNAKIIATGSYLGESIITNKSLESKIYNYNKESGDFSAWVERVSGIKERRYSNLSIEEMAKNSLEQALESSDVKAEDIDMIILNTMGPSNSAQICPNIAQRAGHLIGNNHLLPKQLNNVCAGFIYGIQEAYSHLTSSSYLNTIAIISADKLSSRINYHDPRSAILFGDGASCVILQKSEEPGFLGEPFIGAEFSNAIKIEKYIDMDGGPFILKAAVNKMYLAAQEALNRSKLSSPDFIIPHQANSRIILGLAQKLKSNGINAAVLSNLEYEGNRSGASMMITLDSNIRNNTIKPGNTILFTAIGGGYVYGSFVIRI